MLAEEVGPETCRGDALRAALSGEDTAAAATLYVLLRAVDRFHSTYNRVPGSYDGWVLEACSRWAPAMVAKRVCGRS